MLDLVVTSRVVRAGRADEFYRAARRGRFVRLAEGVYLPTATWTSLGVDDRFLARIQAVAIASRPGLVFSHHSAAALWRLPIIGAWPTKPEVTVGVVSGPSRVAFAARQYPVPDRVEVIDGLKVTGLGRTAIDIGRTAPMTTAVAMMDRALAIAEAEGTTLDLYGEFARTDSPRGRRKCRQALELADGRSESAGESLSRVGMHLLGLPMPILQQEFHDSRGLIGVVDFWWPEFNLIGEFDGHGKYLREELRGGQTVADVVVAEKLREDRLRACGPRMTRWGWEIARSLPRLSLQLRSAGLK
jgi:hypothetical protein